MIWDGPKLWIGIALSAAIAAGLTLGVEEWSRLRRAGGSSQHARREMLLSLGCLIPNSIAAFALMGFWTAVYSRAHDWSPLHIPTTAATSLCALLAVDLTYYWEHRLAHASRLLWRLYHSTHHSSDRCTIATAYRISFANHFIAPAFYIPCVLAGFEPLLVALLQLLVIHYQAWVHTEVVGPLGIVDRVINTPANHRIHHSASEAHQHRNFAAIFIVWDVVFRTRIQPVPVAAFGIPHRRPPTSFWNLHFDNWLRP